MSAALAPATSRRRFETTADYRRLVSAELFERLVNRIVKDEEFDRALAERIMESALGFLYLSATNPGEGFSPSPLVDIGWHTFILYTRSYATFCGQLAGRFIHHEPNDNPHAPQKPGGIQRSIDAFKANNLPVDEMLWTGRLTRQKTLIVLSGAMKADCDDGHGPCSLGNCTCS